MSDRWVFRNTPHYTIEIEETDDYLIFHLPRATRPCIRAWRGDLFALGVVADFANKQVSCGVSVDNEPVLRLVRLLGMTEIGVHPVPDHGDFVIFMKE